MDEINYTLEPIGIIRSELVRLADAPKQGDEGTYEAWLELNADVAEGLEGIKVGDELMVLAWLHRAQRDVLQVHPRGNPNNRVTGVFATRSPDRPNPIGLHRVSVLEIDGQRLRVAPSKPSTGHPLWILNRYSDR